MSNLMKERRIICCGAQGWVGALGTIWIIFNTLFLIRLGMAWGFLWSHQTDTNFLKYELVNSVVLLTCSIIMALLLLCGSCNKNPRQINTWLIFAKIFLVIWVFEGIVELFFTYEHDPYSKLISLCTELIFQIFFIWVVSFHKKEIEASNNSAKVTDKA